MSKQKENDESQDVKITRAKISDLQFDPQNPNIGSERGEELLDRSFERFGAARGVVVDRNGVLVAGNGSGQAFSDTGLEDVIIVDTDGKTLVVTRRQDFDLSDPENPAREYSIADNKVSEARLVWDRERLDLHFERGVNARDWFTRQELRALEKEDDVPAGVNASVFTDEQIIDSAFDYFKEAGFPYYDLKPFEMMQEINALADTESDKLLNTNAAHHVADVYQTHRFEAHAINMKSPLEAFNDDKLLRRSLVLQLRYHRLTTRYLNPLSFVSGTQAASNFRPGVALYYYRKYAVKGGTVLDTSTGYGGRLVGFFASDFDYYIGIDPNTLTHEANLSMVADLGFADNVTLVNLPAEDVALDTFAEQADFAFTSPPYFHKEIYSHDDSQSWKRYSDVDAWCTGFLTPMFKLQLATLKPACFSVVNIADVTINGKTYDLVERTIQAGQDAGFEFIERTNMPLVSRIGAGHDGEVSVEPILIFKKVKS